MTVLSGLQSEKKKFIKEKSIKEKIYKRKIRLPAFILCYNKQIRISGTNCMEIEREMI